MKISKKNRRPKIANLIDYAKLENTKIFKLCTDLSIGSTETKYKKLNTKTPISFNNIPLFYTL